VAISEDLRIGSLEGASAVQRRRTTQELVFEFLRDAILSGRLRGGSRLVQDRIAVELNVSRVPVREALLQLESEGLIRMEAHRGASVVFLSPEEIEEIFELRTVLAAAAARRAVPKLTDDQLERLDKLARRQSSETNMAARARLNHVLYATLFENLDRPRWQATMDKLERQIERYLVPIDRPHLGHVPLVEACKRRDGEEAARLIGEHLEKVGQRAVQRVRDMLAAGEPPVPKPTTPAKLTPRVRRQRTAEASSA
jgi:DNA-binding GntR family transcriptional regulator